MKVEEEFSVGLTNEEIMFYVPLSRVDEFISDRQAMSFSGFWSKWKDRSFEDRFTKNENS